MCSGLKANGPDSFHGPSGPPRISRSLLLFDVVSSLSDTMQRALYHLPMSMTSEPSRRIKDITNKRKLCSQP
jgi:hypothetical protein